MPALTRNGWTILFHDQLLGQLEKLAEAHGRAVRNDPASAASNRHVKVFTAAADHILNLVPADPADPRFRPGNAIGTDYRNWRRAKFYQRFRLIFRFHSSSRIIVFAWLNDVKSLRAKGTRDDVYRVFKRMLDNDNPPGDWDGLMKHVRELPEDLTAALDTLAPEEAD